MQNVLEISRRKCNSGYTSLCRKREKAVPRFQIKLRFIQLMLWFYYNASVNSHSQLLAYLKKDTKIVRQQAHGTRPYMGVKKNKTWQINAV